MTKEQVLQALQEHPDGYVSGGKLAAQLHVSRNAVWKAVEQLRREGYPIDSVSRKGHRLASSGDVLSEAGVRKYLHRPDVPAEPAAPALSSWEPPV